MNNLTTRKIVLGLLMVLVLAFGVQGVVDAVTTGAPENFVDIEARQLESNIGNAGNATGISFTPRLEDTENNQGSDNSNTTETITVSTTNIQLTVPSFTTSTVTFSESTTEDTQTTTSRPLTDSEITLNGYFTREGRATLTIRYTDLSASQAGTNLGELTSTSITRTYTYYVVKADGSIPATTTFRLTNASAGYQIGLNGRTDFSIYSNNTGNYPVTYSVAGGSSYFSDDPYMTSDPLATTTISSSSGTKVWLDMNQDSGFTDEGTTSVVTVDIGETSGNPKSSFNVAYIIGTPKLGINLTAATDPVTMITNEPMRDRYRFSGGSVGEDVGTIMATVRDGSSATGSPIAGVLVKFELQQKGSTAGYLSLDEGTRVDERNNTEPAKSLPGIAQTLYVRTVAGGIATVAYRFGTLRSQQINVSSVGLSKNVTAEIGTGQTDQQISVKTNRQQSGDSEKFDLVAEVEDGDGEPIDDVPVTFSTDRGTLTRITPTPDSFLDPVTTTDEEVDVVTNTLGEAHVVYDIGSHTGRQEITASFVDGTDRESVIFVINGSGRRDPPPGGGEQTARLTIRVDGTGTTRAGNGYCH